mmetsp:Transcript_15421/g.26070  ORF Transcript_15421/g.26070 Transcript_15421/m.26070 type:complete len:163 (+) Transcript_15421:293-781(+)
MCCGFHLKKCTHQDKRRKVELANMLTDLMVFDLPNQEGGVDSADFEECLDEFMQTNYNTEVDLSFVQQIAKNLLTIRREFVTSAMETSTLVSPEFRKWVKFSRELQQKQPEYEKVYQKMKEQFKNQESDHSDGDDEDGDDFWDDDDEADGKDNKKEGESKEA